MTEMPTTQHAEETLREAYDFMLKAQYRLPPEAVTLEFRALLAHLEKRINDGPSYSLTPEEMRAVKGFLQ